MVQLQFTDFALDDRRFNWYFDKYQLRANIKFPGIQYFRYIKSIEDFENRLNQSIGQNYLSGSKSSRTTVRTRVEKAIPVLQKFIEWKLLQNSSKTDFICRIAYDSVDIYTNDLRIIQDLKSLIDYDNKVIFNFFRAEKIPNFERSVVYHKNPKHNYRVYLSSRVWTFDERKSLLNFLDEHSSQAFACQSLMEWMTRVYRITNANNARWSNNSFFIDFDDEQFITYFGLKFNGSIGKLCHIKKR